jgi:hypothetical protein
MAKDIKEINLGYNNDISYDTSHREVSLFAVIGVSMRWKAAANHTPTTSPGPQTLVYVGGGGEVRYNRQPNLNGIPS